MLVGVSFGPLLGFETWYGTGNLAKKSGFDIVNENELDWQDGSMVKSADCSSEGPKFKSQQPPIMRSDALFWSERSQSEQVLNSIPNNHMKAYSHLYSYSVLIYIK